METKLSETRPQLATLLQSIGDAVIVTDGDGMILSMNPAAETTMGWTQEEVIGKAVTLVLQLVDEETLLPVEGHVFGALYEGRAMSLSRGWLLILRDGTALPIDLSATLVRDSHENFSGAILTLRGVAEPRRTVEAFQEVFQKVQQAKREWECTVDALSDVILLADNSGHVLRANRAVEDWSLGRVTEVGGRTVHDLIHHDCLDPDCYLDAFVRGALRQTTRGQTVGHEVYDQVLNRYLLLYAQPVRDPKHNAVQATVIVLQDITERKQTEEMLRQYAAELQARNEELDAFAHTVAHDLKNPVGLVMGYAEILLKDRVIASNSDLAEGLHIIARTGRKMNDIIEELLLLAQVRNEPVQTEPLSMGSIVDEAQQRLVRIIQECGAEIILPQDWPQASGYGPWVEEVWANYLCNALRYGGTPPHLKLGATEQPDGMVRFWVRDHGPGLTPEQQAHLFTPFTRLDRARKGGHGLGLSIVRRIIEKLGGQVGVESAGVPGLGSVFYFTLPALVSADQNSSVDGNGVIWNWGGKPQHGTSQGIDC